MKTKKKLFAVLVILAMVATMVPIMTFADSPDKTADFSTNPQEAITLLGGDAKATWQNNTLTLNGVDFTTTAATALIVPSGTTIKASGTNKIVSTYVGAADSYGIYAKGGILTFDSESSGSLIVKSGNVSGSEKESAGIINENGEMIFSGGNITGEGGTSANSLSIGICSRKINAGSGDITVSGGSVTATGSSGMYSYGMIAIGKLTVSGETLNITGGTAINQSEGIYAREIEVSDGSVTATGGATTGTNGYSGGIVTSKNIESGNNFIVSGGTVTATGGVVTDPNAYTIGVLTKLFTISGNGAVTASGDNAAAYSGGVISYGDININNTGLTAKGNKVAVHSGEEDNNRAVIFGTGVTAKASTNYDGTNYTNYKTANIDKYKWVKSSAKTVEAPGFSLAEGAYTGIQKVKLSCSFPEDAAIEYSINDGNYQSYTKGSDITIDKNMNIKARASKADWGPVEEEISEANYTINLPIKISPSKSFVKGSCGGDYTAIIGEGMNIDPESLNKVSMDGQELEEGEAYTTQTGSIRIILKEKYLNTLTVGKHTLVADIHNNNFGEVSPSIDIIVKAPDSATKTGDDTNMALPIGIAIAALIAVAALLITRKRHNG